MSDALPELCLRKPEDEVGELLRSLRAAILTHPVAAQAMFRALIAEGRAYARTQEGEEQIRRLERSRLLRSASAVWEATSLWTIDESGTHVTPTGYLDALFLMSAQSRRDEHLERALQRGSDADAAARS